MIVERVLSDNGSAYKAHLWRAGLGITVKKTRPYRPITRLTDLPGQYTSVTFCADPGGLATHHRTARTQASPEGSRLPESPTPTKH